MVSFRLYRPVPVPVFYEMDSHITKKMPALPSSQNAGSISN
ncbi:hypothetical protein HMPREF9347_00273 [Escherichia coli MS 124-1]|nr:hypothetical protein HMPREF9347_00273 [Escherichia coli MS 124-1]